MDEDGRSCPVVWGSGPVLTMAISAPVVNRLTGVGTDTGRWASLESGRTLRSGQNAAKCKAWRSV